MNHTISNQDIDRFVNTLKTAKQISKVFELTSFQQYLKGYQIRLGNTALYADFPRGGYVLQNIICSICNNIIIEANVLKKGVEIIKKQSDPISIENKTVFF